MTLAEAIQMVNECEFIGCRKTPIDHKLWLCSDHCWRYSKAIGMTVTVADHSLNGYDELWQWGCKDESKCGYLTDGSECECGYVRDGIAQDSSGEHGGGLMVKFPHLKDALFIHHMDIEALTDKDGTIYPFM